MLEDKVADTENKRSQAERLLGKCKNEIETCKKQLVECERIALLLTEPEQAEHFPKLTDFLPETAFSMANISQTQTDTRQRIEGIESEKSKLEKKLSESLIRRMQNYKNNYAAEYAGKGRQRDQDQNTKDKHVPTRHRIRRWNLYRDQPR